MTGGIELRDQKGTGPSSAEELQHDGLMKKVLNLDVTFHWIDRSDRFWFRRETRGGDETVIVDAASGVQSLAIDGELMPGDTGISRPGRLVVSPNGLWTVARRENDLWLRDLSRGDECRITHDGTENFGYGDIDPWLDRREVSRGRAGQRPPLRGILWSPKSRYIIAIRQDLRSYPERLFVVEYAPPSGAGALAHLRRLPLAADASPPDSKLVLIDAITHVSRAINLDPQALNDFALQYYLEGVLWWVSEESKLFMLTANRGGSRYALISIDVATGETREVVQEIARFNVRLNPFDYARPNVHVSGDGAEVIWYSERSGHGHLYLYDASTGNVKRQITHGAWVVFDLLRIEEESRLVYFTGARLDGSGNPYYRYLYRVSMDGGEPHLLTPEIADHHFANLFEASRGSNGGYAHEQSGSSISPSGRYFIDCYSTTEQPPTYVLRETSGRLIDTILVSDATELYGTGWRPPERVIAKAADGATDLYGVITLPRDFDPSKRYPVIDSMYPGPQGSFAPRTFKDQIYGGSINHLQAFADAGFVVIALDGRGTAHRSRAFRDAFLRTDDVFGASDHVAAIKYLASTRPYMDRETVGVRGQSFGGYGSLRAMLLFPDFFKVGVSATGPSDWLDMPGQISVERFFGVPTDSLETRRYYERISNVALVSNLKGRVLLIYGGLDENVPLSQCFVVSDAFIKADKDYDMLVMPECSHGVAKDPYAVRRSVEYFVRNLAGRT